jgi:hypothetical protein
LNFWTLKHGFVVAQSSVAGFAMPKGSLMGVEGLIAQRSVVAWRVQLRTPRFSSMPVANRHFPDTGVEHRVGWGLAAPSDAATLAAFR